ncbi:response regulator [Candidatus Desantisbacteria bacterium]|nr:response regulator [Candidatus Desantisbacteria bacterium]
MEKTILVIEDDVDIQNYYEIILSDLNLDCDILRAYNGKEALEIIDSGKHVNLIILDIVMPIIDGEKFLHELQVIRKNNIPVIISTVDEVFASGISKKAKFVGVFNKLDKIEKLTELIKKNL